MPGLDRDIAEHHIPMYLEARLVKQKLRRLRPEWAEKIREEIAKQIQANFLEVIIYYMFKYIFGIKTTLLQSHPVHESPLKARFHQN